MITRFLSICNFGSFTDFDWNQVVRDKGNNIVDFSKLNILYGRNYSGKTTISRIVDSLDKKCLPDDYAKGKFQISHSECGEFCECDLSSSEIRTKVYNTDFVKKNLGLQDEDGEILPFAIVGEKNVETEKKIEALTQEIGDENSGLAKNLIEAQKDHQNKKKRHEQAVTSLQSSLRNNAREIKNNSKLFDDPNYNIASIKSDIKTVTSNNCRLTEEDRVTLTKTAHETSKPRIDPIQIRTPQYSILLESSCKLLSQEIKPSKSIKELLENTELQEWVRKGTRLHRDERSTCAFCGNQLPKDLWDKIDSHFSKESEEHRAKLEHIRDQIDSEIAAFKPKVRIPAMSIYAQLNEQFDTQLSECNQLVDRYIDALKHLKAAINSRLGDIFKPSKYESQFEDCKKLNQLQDVINQSIKENNDITAKLGAEQQKARVALRLDSVQSFIESIEYDKKIKEVGELEKESKGAALTVDKISKLINNKKIEIDTLENELSDERKGAAKVNSYLNHYFGHKALELSPEKESSGSKFVLKREGEPATNLSEGECSLVAFCYFMAKLHEVGSEADDSVIWIDDPISSLDNNHIFFIFSLIENELAKPKKYRQLFISTHNLDFLKYLKKMTVPRIKENGKKVKLVNYFVIENDNKCSRIRPMPNYLVKYTTEFNYLFEIIYQCSIQPELEEASFDYYYSFGNNLRKFLESYLFYKYPNQGSLQEKIGQFFDPDHESTVMINRVVNEYSHLFEAVDRGTKPIDVPEMKSVASYVLSTIQQNDKEQYSALLKSIGAPEPN